jgi:HK97 family phage portal protein
MNSLQRIAGAITRPFRLREKQLPGGGYMLPLGGGYIPGNWPWNFWQLGYDPLSASTGSTVVAACVASYAQTLAMCPGTHWRTTDDNGRERVDTSALSRILKKPNGYQTISDFLLNLTTDLYEEGNAYALALRNDRFEVSELHLFDPRLSYPRVAPTGDIFYSLSGNNVAERGLAEWGAESDILTAVPARDVMHVRLKARRTYQERPLIGEPPLVSAMADIAASNLLVQQALAYTANAGRPSGVLQTDLTVSPEGLAELRRKWIEQTTGANTGGTPILTSGLKWTPTIPTSRDAQLAEVLALSDQRIATAYRVPLQLLGLGGGAAGLAAGGRSTETLMQFWIATGFGFAANHIELAFNGFFGLRGYPDQYMEFDTQALLRSAFKDRIDGLAAGVKGGIYSPNEARAEMDLPEVEFGDDPRVQQQDVPLSFWGQNPPKPTATPPPPPPPPEEKPNGAARAEWTRSILDAAARHDQRRSAA